MRAEVRLEVDDHEFVVTTEADGSVTSEQLIQVAVSAITNLIPRCSGGRLDLLV